MKHEATPSKTLVGKEKTGKVTNFVGWVDFFSGFMVYLPYTNCVIYGPEKLKKGFFFYQILTLILIYE